jgi:glycosyltransferase involved in cell wall biosynthesis
LLFLARLYNQNLISKQKVFCAFVGNGENMELLKDHIKRLNLESNIFLVGYQQNSDDFIAACDLFILPSIKDEDMPLVILSALGYGKTIIATDFAGISQVIENNINGLLLSSNVLNLTNNLSNAIFELYTNEGKRIELATNAKKSYVKYSPQTYGFNLNKIYEQVFTS